MYTHVVHRTIKQQTKCVCFSVVNRVQETTAHEVVMLSMTEFNISEPSQ